MTKKMLTEKEKREMLADAKSPKRREDFRAGVVKSPPAIPSFDAYLQFLDDLQAIYGPFECSRTPTPTHRNKL